MLSLIIEKGGQHCIFHLSALPIKEMRKNNNTVCFILVLMMLLWLPLAAFADAASVEPEEIVDAVAESEAAAAEQAAREAAEAAKVNDVVDMDSASSDPSSGEVVPNTPDSSADQSASHFGPMLALAVAFILIVCGLLIVIASNRKIKAGKKQKTGR